LVRNLEIQARDRRANDRAPTVELQGRVTKRFGKVIAVLVGVSVTAFVAFVGFLRLQPRADAYIHATRFNSAAWKARSVDDGPMWPTRLRMVDDLLNRNLRSAVPRADIENLLGPPDETSYFRDWDLVYWLGPERGFIRIDSEWLVFKLDAGGRVADYRIVRD
jgi:hypothetical protein